MALSKAEIELLIKARNEAQGAFDQLNKQVKSVTGESEKATEGMDKLQRKTRDGGVAAGAAGVAFGLLAERVGRGLVTAFQDTIAAANRLDAGLIGLKSVASAFKQDAGAAEEAAKKLAADGLLSVGEAATSLKNLLAAGFGLPEAVTLVERFKDSAAFGRQAALGFGQAVSSATEGIKNGNSILVDNAGVTKNLSQILVEAGFSAQDLSKASGDVNIRMALFKGIVKETNPQLGDAAKFLDTAAGKQAQFSAQVEIAQQKIGKALQPALAAALDALLPFVQALGTAAPVLIPLATLVAATLGPLAAMRAAAALGIPSLKDMGTAITGVNTALRTNVFTTAASQTTQAGTAAASAAGSFGKLQMAVAVAGAAFAGWQIGRVIAETFDLDTKISNLTAKLLGYGDMAGQVAGAKQDVINRAIANGAQATIQYTQAIQYNQQIEAIRIANTDKSTAAQRRMLDAKLALSQITKAQYDADVLALGAEEQRQVVTQRGLALRASLVEAEKKYRDEITSTGQSQGQLLVALSQNEDAFEAWAKTVGLSDSTVKRLKDSLKDAEGQKKKNTAAAKELADQQKQLADQLASTAGVLTQGGYNEELKKLQVLLDLAAKNGSPALATATRNLSDEFEELRAKAVASNLAVADLDGVYKKAAESSGVLVATTRDFSKTLTAYPVATVNRDTQGLLQTTRDQIVAQQQLTDAYAAFGIKTPEDLRKAAAAAEQNYAILVSSGTASTQTLKAAYAAMIEAQREATGKLPSYWQTEVAPIIQRTVEQLGTAIQGTFAQMLLGAKGFGDGFKDIWESIKASAAKVFTEILQDFTGRFLKGLMGALSGQQGAFSKAFGGLFGGGGGVPGVGGGGGIFGNGGILGGLFGGGAASNSPQIAAAGLGFPGGGGAAGAGGIGGLGAAGIFGGLGAGAAGVGLGFLGKELFGGAGVKAGAFGAGGGAATGALIGSVVPGLGTAVGAIIGGLAGALSGAIGKTQGEKTNDVRDKFLAQFGGAGTGEGSGFLTVAQELSKLGAEVGGGEGGGSLFKNLIGAKDLKSLEAAVKAVTAAMAQAKTATTEVADATTEAADGGESFTERYKDSIRTVRDLKEQSGELQEQIDAVGAEGGDISGLNRQMRDLWNTIRDAEREALNLADAMRSIPGAPVGSGSTSIPIVPEGGAAGGVFANRPGLVLFGEGGEQEVGGPKSFFKQVFDELGVPTAGAGGSGAGGSVVNLSVTINALDGANVRDVFLNQIIPLLKDALRTNAGGVMSDLKAVLR
jgi:hypothetical protein